MKKKNQALNFVLMAFGISWTASAMKNLFSSGDGGGSFIGLFSWITYMLGPLVAAFVIEKFMRDQPISKSLKISFKPNRWFLFALTIMFVVIALSIGVSLLMPDVEFSWELEGWYEKMADVMPADNLEEMRANIEQSPIHVVWITVITALLLGPTLMGGIMLVYEIGWRGSLFKELAHFGFWNSSLLIGFLAGIWWMPTIMQNDQIQGNLWMNAGLIVLWSTLLSPLLCYIALKANSIIASAIGLGVLFSCMSIPQMVLYGGSDLIVSPTGLSGIIVLLIFLLLIHFFDTKFTEAQLTTLDSLEDYWDIDKSDEGIS
ncbi:MAG: hypothetical protein GY810_08090 [Aureispira sp.]|nr:hypothetical protein [Aureispira sp.]